MADLTKAKEPFRFYTRLHLSELTGLRAATLGQLLRLIKEVSGSSIYHHTHRFLQQHQYLSPEPPNDFAYWITEVLGEDELGENLASIDTVRYSTIRELRDKIAETIERYLKNRAWAKLKFAREGEEFHFVKSVSFILPTKYIVCNLIEFVDALRKITIDSIYFHVFEARLRLERGNNDFSNWIGNAIGDNELAYEISRLDPYAHTLEGLRSILIKLIENKISML
ncbi:MAG: DUF5752 family protein [Candidatus Omnitrophica bacterium]|nr:DUF5752 family protein [Candidatus Omnitrophota bacterium]